MLRHASFLPVVLLFVSLAGVGCRSPYYADQGALFGGLTGAGIGALVGDANGNAAAGTAIGAGLGAMTGAVVGESLDEIDARNRAAIAAQLGRPVATGAVTTVDVVSMTEAGVDDSLIINHIRNNGVASPPQASDVITLHEQGVSTAVIEAMQAPPPRPAPAQGQSAQPVIIEEHYHEAPRPYHHPAFHYRHHRGHHHRPVHWGFSFSS